MIACVRARRFVGLLALLGLATGLFLTASCRRRGPVPPPKPTPATVFTPLRPHPTATPRPGEPTRVPDLPG
jgi:hypothetical protein